MIEDFKEESGKLKLLQWAHPNWGEVKGERWKWKVGLSPILSKGEDGQIPSRSM